MLSVYLKFLIPLHNRAACYLVRRPKVLLYRELGCNPSSETADTWVHAFLPESFDTEP